MLGSCEGDREGKRCMLIIKCMLLMEIYELKETQKHECSRMKMVIWVIFESRRMEWYESRFEVILTVRRHDNYLM